MTKYDAIVIGAGHNGLIASSYLAKGGEESVGRGCPWPSGRLCQYPSLCQWVSHLGLCPVGTSTR
jgi:hypothetical protein